MINKFNRFGKTKTSKLIGKEILSRDEFIEWCFGNIESFNSIYNEWKKSGFKRKLSPSIDRIDNSKGYSIGNMRWITQQENSIKYNK